MRRNKETKRKKGRPAKNKPTQQIAVRVELDLLKRIDSYVKQIEENVRGMKVTRAEAVRSLLLYALGSIEFNQNKERFNGGESETETETN